MRDNLSRSIYQASLGKLRSDPAYRRLLDFPPEQTAIIERMAHACGSCALVSETIICGQLQQAVRRALAQGAKVLCDAKMVAAGIIRRHLPAGTLVRAARVNYASSPIRSRTARGVAAWQQDLSRAIVIVGQNPSALRQLLQMFDQGTRYPRALIATPVGYHDAADAKQALLAKQIPAAACPHLVLPGNFGGSAIACAAFNACLETLDQLATSA